MEFIVLFTLVLYLFLVSKKVRERRKEFSRYKQEAVFSEQAYPEIVRYKRILHKLLPHTSLIKDDLFLIVSNDINQAGAARLDKDCFLFLNLSYAESVYDYELEGVIGHELGHLSKRYAMTTAQIFAAISSLHYTTILVAFLAVLSADVYVAHVMALFIANWLFQLFFLKLIRMEEYRADAHSAKICGNPDGLIGFLRRQMAHDFLLKILVSQNKTSWLKTELFSSHPDTKKRIEALYKYKK